jgi:hypothetical protein
MGWTSQDTEESISPSIENVNRKSSIGFERTQDAGQDTLVTKREIMNYCATQFQIKLTQGWANSVVLRLSGELTQTGSALEQYQLFQVPRAFLQGTVQDLNDHMQGCVANWFSISMKFPSRAGKSQDEGSGRPAAMFGQLIHQGVS